MLAAENRIQNGIEFADPEFQKSIQLVGISLLLGEVIGEFFLPVFSIKAKPVVKFFPDHVHVYFLEIVDDVVWEGHTSNLQNTK